ncbi:MAG: translation initiation factor IF-2, partial [Clostridia bacterium]|nr:translation initiation factor IF-2 [Clostridia bacterium]
MIVKYRVHEVAKDFGVPSKEIIEIIKKYTGEEKKHMTSLTDTELNIIFEYFTQKINMINSEQDYLNIKKPELKKSNNNKIKNNKNIKESQEKIILSGSSIKKDQENIVSLVTEDDITPANKIINTRFVNVNTENIDKYNEKYDRIALDKLTSEHNIHKQKITQKSQQRNKYKTKKETESEKLKRIEQERKAKQMTVLIPDEITVGELALRLKATAAQVIKKLMSLGVMASISDTIDFDTASIVAMEFHAKVEKEEQVSIEELIIDSSEDKPEDLITRAPVVVVMGHVDHGKTSLLDAIRQTDVTSGEAGGITQHIGAYRVNLKNNQEITFLDTPGHEAFTTMRARGAQVTDIAILVVAADDGIKPQTVEAINHAKAAEVSIIVAINKIDKPDANPDRVLQQLTEHNILPEEWGGDVPCIRVSARTKSGLQELLDMVLLVSELKELKANPNRKAKGTVIEARLDKGRGPIATILVQNGTLNTGDIIVAGTSVGRVRAMTNDKNMRITSAGPSVPVEITGLDTVPTGGDIVNVVSNE